MSQKQKDWEEADGKNQGIDSEDKLRPIVLSGFCSDGPELSCEETKSGDRVTLISFLFRRIAERFGHADNELDLLESGLRVHKEQSARSTCATTLMKCVSKCQPDVTRIRLAVVLCANWFLFYIVLFIISSVTVPCCRLTWQPVSFPAHVKHFYSNSTTPYSFVFSSFQSNRAYDPMKEDNRRCRIISEG